MEVIRWP